ncbi:MAG: SDR family oxidoreductase [Sphingomonadaceae bacterium]|nr:SDR family oxidoreductase [Sphingomonadaceae bacterium]
MSDNANGGGCVIVFGASGGIGSAITRVLALDGMPLALVCNRKRDMAEQLAAEIGQGASVHRGDVSTPDGAAGIIAEALATHGRISGLVWAAGPLVQQHFMGQVSDEEWQRSLDIETSGFFRALRAVLPAMKRNGGGAIVHLGSAGHLRWPDRDGLSVVPKAANEALVKGIAREEGRHGIRANSVLVGVIDAGMFHELMEQGQFPDGWVEETLKALAIKRWGQAEEVGHAVSWLLSDKSAYVTGQQIAVAGGYGI